ncbi:hypothetical protein ABZ092_36025 [Streptomyces bobili]|uniref:hypothetical protein n=1 Tax=Streptomyces bobili TaxID=67280 RepID=UPI0033B35788
MKKPLIVASLVAVLLGVQLSNSPASASPAVKPTAAKYAATPSLPTRPCADDSDDRNCYWDAAKRGNGKGYSYIVDRAGNVTYLNPKLNDKKKRAAWKRTNQAAKREYWGTVWGHRLCYAKVGNTSYIYCFDGFRETS